MYVFIEKLENLSLNYPQYPSYLELWNSFKQISNPDQADNMFLPKEVFGQMSVQTRSIRTDVCANPKYSDRCLCKPEVFGQMSVQTRSIRTDVCANPKYSDRCLCKPEVFGQMSVQTHVTWVCTDICPNTSFGRNISESIRKYL